MIYRHVPGGQVETGSDLVSTGAADEAAPYAAVALFMFTTVGYTVCP